MKVDQNIFLHKLIFFPPNSNTRNLHVLILGLSVLNVSSNVKHVSNFVRPHLAPSTAFQFARVRFVSSCSTISMRFASFRFNSIISFIFRFFLGCLYYVYLAFGGPLPLIVFVPVLSIPHILHKVRRKKASDFVQYVR